MNGVSKSEPQEIVLAFAHGLVLVGRRRRGLTPEGADRLEPVFQFNAQLVQQGGQAGVVYRAYVPLFLESVRSLHLPREAEVIPVEQLDERDRRNVLAAYREADTAAASMRAAKAGVLTPVRG